MADIEWLNPEGGIVFSGEAEDTIQMSHDPSGELVFSGSSPNTVQLTFNPTGGLVFSSSAFFSISYNFFGDGGVSFSNTTPFYVTYGLIETFTWYTEGTIGIDQEFSWNVGQPDLSWYRIEGECITPSCDTTNLETNDSRCNSTQFIQVIAARGLSDLCLKLREGVYTGPVDWPIKSIKRYTRPFDGTEPQDECQELVEEEFFCDVLECLELCLDFDGVQTDLYSYMGAFAEIEESVPYSFASDGVMTFSGDAVVACSNWIYIPTGGLRFYHPDDPSVTIIGEGGITFGGSANVVLPFGAVSSGGLTFGGTSPANGFNWMFIYSPSGTLTFGSSAPVYSSNYSYVGDGGIVFGGEASIQSSFWTYTPSGGMVFSGIASIGREHIGSGQITFGSSAIKSWGTTYSSSGNILFGGTAVTGSPSYQYVPLEGGIVFSGEAVDNFLNTDSIILGAESDIDFIELELISEEEEETGLSITEGVVNSGCSSCDPLGLTLNLTHNIIKTNTLFNFLNRNNLTLPTLIPLRYREPNNSWMRSYNFLGTGEFSTSPERWQILFEWGCTDTLGATELDENVWKLSIFIQKIYTTTGEDAYTRVLMAFPQEIPCLNNLINFSVKYNVVSEITTTTPSTTPQIVLVTDEIGLFKNKFWETNPFLNISIKETRDTNSINKYDISPIFPE